VRVIGVDFGLRRIGLAISDPSGTLARPWKTLGAGDTPQASALAIAAAVAGLRTEDETESEVADVVVGVPVRLNGEESDQTWAAREFARSLEAATGLRVHLQDERLTSHEADRLLAERERDWRRRKEKLDAAAAAIILQDYLDQRARSAEGPDPGC
jgi:putative Holliday junction resolvase